MERRPPRNIRLVENLGAIPIDYKSENFKRKLRH